MSLRQDGQKRPLPPLNSKRLLSLDGGGVKGISSMMILNAIIARARAIEGKPTDPEQHKAYDYFDLAGGTSTGGLAALMLFRLRMDVPLTIKKYETLARTIFSPTLGPFGVGPFKTRIFYPHEWRWKGLGYAFGNPLLWIKAWRDPSRFEVEPFERAINRVMEETGRPPASTISLLERDPKPRDIKKMFMCSTLAAKGESILFRNYTLSEQAGAAPVSTKARLADFSDISIMDAAKATSAAPTYLPEVKLTREVDAQDTVFRFWDGGLLNNNPVHQVWDNRYDLDESPKQNQTPVTTCVVSIGCGWSDPKPPPSGLFARTRRFVGAMLSGLEYATNTEAKHRDFERNVRRINQRLSGDPGDTVNEKTAYFRFNTPTFKEDFNLDDYQQMPRLKQLTEKYLEESEVQRKIDECAHALVRQPWDDSFDP